MPDHPDAPPTPNVPVLRHLTWDELHAFEFGAWWGVSIGLTFGMGHDYLGALGLLSFRRVLLGGGGEEIRKLRKEIWYMTSGAFVGFLVGLGLAVPVRLIQQV